MYTPPNPRGRSKQAQAAKPVLSIRVDAALLAKIDEIGDTYKISTAELVRRAIDREIAIMAYAAKN